MGFATYGNPAGIPTFFFHGSPGSRYDGSGLVDPAARFNLHIICPDRPGHGLSTFQPNRKLIDYPADISQLAAHLKIPQYHVLGQSGGGPYVVACAHGSPTNELLSANVIAGMGPPDTLRPRIAGWYTVVVVTVCRYFPSLVRAAFNYSVAKPSRIQRQLDLLERFLTPEDRATISSPQARETIMTHLMQAYAQGADGVIRETQIVGEPWGFELRDVKSKVNLFYGTKDDRTPLAYGQFYADHLPIAELVVLEGASHFTTEKWDDVVFGKIFGVKPEDVDTGADDARDGVD